MKRLFTTLAVLLFVLLLKSELRAQSWLWAIKPIGMASTNFDNNDVTGVTIDALNNVYIVGQFNDSATFSATKLKSMAGLDMYIAKLNSIGQLQWVRTVAGPQPADQAIDIAVDPSGNAYMAGMFYDSVRFEGTWIRQAGLSSIALAKYNSSGTLQWARLVEGLSVGVFGGVEYSPTGHVYVGASHTLGKYTLLGDTVWTMQVPLASNTFMIRDLAVDKNGTYVYITGQFSGQVDVGGVTLNSGGLSNWDFFVAKLDQDGNVIWARQAGSAVNLWADAGYSLDIDQAGNVYVCGQYTGAANFQGTILDAGSSLWSTFVAKYNSSGTLQWVKGGTGASVTLAMATEVRLVSNETAILVAGSFSATVTFNGTTYSIQAGGDALLLKMSSDGATLWSKQSGSTLAIITINGMDVNATTNAGVLIGNHTSMQATFTPFVFTTPPVGVADGLIVGFSTDSPTPVEEVSGSNLPSAFNLEQNYPNPFNPSTTIAFSLPKNAQVDLVVLNVLGQQVRVLIDEELSAGSYRVDWDGRDQQGEAAATGVYLYRLRVGDQTESRKMLLVK